MRFGILHFFSVLAACVALGPVADAAEAYHRLAVIGSPALAKSGLTDLISAEVQEGGVELVEREQLNTLIHEQTLDATLGADGCDKRIEFGRLAKADALVLLREEGAGKERRVHLIIAECAQGARLSSAFYPAGGSVAEMAHSIASQVAETRKRFSGGVKAMIGVPPFIARSFTYEYHPLQAGYAALLCEALNTLPGVAVIEVEEAKAIRKELDTSGGKVHGVVPVFVEGEFEVLAKAGLPASVNFKITVDAAKQSRTIDHQGLSLLQASQFVSRELPNAIVPAGGAAFGQPFIPEKEFAKLTERADAFAKVAEWAHSIELRNAALVIQPDDVDQRMKLLNECIALLKSSGGHDDARAGQTRTSRPPGFVASIFEMALQNLEWAFRNLGPDDLNAAVAVPHLLMNGRLDVGPTEQATLWRLVHEFMLNVYPVVTFNPSKANPPTDMSARIYRYQWSETALDFAIQYNRGPAGDPDYGLIFSYLNDILPDNQPSSAKVMKLLQNKSRPIPAWANGAARLPYTHFEDFVKRLAESKRPEIRLLARYQNLYMRVTWKKVADESVSSEIAELRQAWNDLKIDPIPTPMIFVNRSLPPGNSTALLVELDCLQEEVLAIRKMKLAAQPAPPPIAASDSNRLIHFEKIPLRYERADGSEIKPQYYAPDYQYALHVIRCTDSLDVYWCPRRLAFMRVPGVLVETPDLLAAQKILDVKWDGAFLWIATAANELLKMDPAGHVVSRLGAAQDLPPFDGGAVLTILGPGQLAITGCFGAGHRAFIATVIGEKSSYKVNILHKAIRVAEPGKRSMAGAPADQAFVPETSNLCRSKAGARFLIVGRRGDSRPLIVNLASSAVAVSETVIEWPPIGFDGGLVTFDINGKICRFLRPTDAGNTFVNDLPPVRFDATSANFIGPGEQIYVVGQTIGWCQLDPRTMVVTPLTDRRGFMCSALGVSAHYGCVGWDFSFPVHRVTLDTDKIKAIPETDRLRPAPPAAGQRPDGQWAQITHFDADPLLVGKPFEGHLTLRFPAAPTGKNFVVRVDYSIYRGDTMLGGFHENRGFQAGYSFVEMADRWQVHRTDLKTSIENIKVVPAAGEYRIVATLVSDIDGFVYGSKTINVTAR